jgi:hypothetical protein
MDKMARKPYLQPFGRNRSVVPKTLRLLTVDLPEVAQHGFLNSVGQCRLATDHVFPDGVAQPLQLSLTAAFKKKRKKRNEQREELLMENDVISLEIELKAWVQSMFHCYHGRRSVDQTHPQTK